VDELTVVDNGAPLRQTCDTPGTKPEPVSVSSTFSLPATTVPGDSDAIDRASGVQVTVVTFDATVKCLPLKSG